MGIRSYKPTSPGRRFGTVSDFGDVTKKSPEKTLLEPARRTGGRSTTGRLTQRRMGGGAQRHYRKIDFRRDKDGVPASVAGIEYDPNRSSRIALLHYQDGEKRYILAPLGLKPGQVVLSGEREKDKVEAKDGNCMRLGEIPLGLKIHNIELTPGKGGQIVRSAGSFAELTAREGEYALVTLPSGEIRKIHVKCRATLGQLSNVEHNLVSIGKAGRSRWMGWRPFVRGVAMNPVAHPMGGGEGRSHGGRHPCSPTGKLAKGGKTRRPKARSTPFILRRRKGVRYQ